MATSGWFGYGQLTGRWSLKTQSTSSNISVVTATATWSGNQDITAEYGVTISLSVNGVTQTKTVYAAYSTISIETTIYHDSAGNASLRINCGYSGYTSANLSNNYSDVFYLPTIPRPASILSAPNFTDEENPTITYNNPMGENVSKLEACISFEEVGSGGTVNAIVPFREIPVRDIAYTFELTPLDKKAMRLKVVGSNTKTVYFIIRTTINNHYYHSTIAKTYTVVNANPVIQPIVEDGNDKTYALTGNRNTFVKYFSDAIYFMSVAATKGAVIVSQKVVCGNKENTSDAGSLDKVESRTFVFSATDNRNNTTTLVVEKGFIDYKKLTCNLVAPAPTTEGNATLTITGNYFMGTFGATSNQLELMYRIKEDDGGWSEWRPAYAVADNDTYQSITSLTGLDYRKKYSFQAKAVDKLMAIESNVRTVKTTPVFDWSEDDFAFNVPVMFNAGYQAHNTLLWQGAYFMTANQTAPLASPISEQPNGIVLVFSNYDTTNSKANDYDWHCYFVPKYLVDIKGGTGHCFNMMSQSFGDIASKYIYISDDSLTGHDNNTKAATNNGINYTNAKYVLRYVFGV